MNKIKRIIIISLASLILASGVYAQDGGNRQRPNNQRQGNRQPVDVEQWKAQQAQQIKANTYKFMELMGEDVPEEQKQPLGQIVQDHLVGQFKLRLAMMSAREQAGEDRQKMRQIMMGVRAKTEELTADTNKKAKALLEKKAYRKFQKTLDQVAPQQQQRGGPGGGRGGPGGGRGGPGGGGAGSRG
ncbi:MAG: hypothetical protein AB3N63_19770 [Puniceicoccaceae bacterium]